MAMDSPEEKARQKAQSRALQVSSGATIETKYLARKSEVVAVNRNDLDDLMQFDGIEFGLFAVGQFFLAGGLWLFVEKFLDPQFKWDALSGFCLSASLFGAVMMLAGWKMRSIKRGKIQRIFNETSPAKSSPLTTR